MGEVYRARDPRIERDVAIKILPEEISSNASRLQRFEQEARAAGKLNHPNILAIHDVDLQNGMPYVVYELLEGETLRDRVAKGQVGIRKTIDYALQIAHGLAAAHDKGIIHRDLKPDNIFITRDDRVKILDFGLAKLFEGVNETQAQTDVPTRKVNTAPGVVIGTVGYMSPEQVVGERADHRSDIFSLGVVLYEMLSGERPFRGASAVETLNAILKDEPAELPSDRNVQPSIDRVMRRCLEKKPEHRFQSAHDLAFALETVSETSTSTRTQTISGSARTRLLTREHVAWIVAGVLLVVAIAALVAYYRKSTTTSYSSQFLVYPPERSIFSASDLNYPVALSPDGQQLALSISASGQSQIWLRDLRSLDMRPLANTEGAQNPFWSPDGQFIAFFAGRKLKKIPAGGGVATVICDAVPTLNTGTWSSDGTILFTTQELERGILRVDSSGGEPKELLKPDRSRNELLLALPQFLPDGKHFFYIRSYTTQKQPTNVYVASLDGSLNQSLFQAPSRVFYSPPGYVLYVVEGTLVARQFNPSDFKLSGEPMTVVEGVGNFSRTGNAYVSVSANGEVLAYLKGGPTSRLVWLDRAGHEQGTIGEPADYRFLRLSPDGQKLAMNLMNVKDGTTDIWLLDLNRGTPTRLTFQPGMKNGTVWSADGRRIAYAYDRDGPPHLFVKELSDVNEGEMLLAPGEAGPQYPMAWTADGRTLVFRQVSATSRSDIFSLSMDGDHKRTPIVQTPANDSEARLSPDGKWLAYVSDLSGRNEVYVQAFPIAGERSQISNSGGRVPRWSADGRELFYLSADLKLMSVAVNAGAAFEATAPVALFAIAARDFEVAHDGRFLVNTFSGVPAVPISVITNWLGRTRL